MSGPPLSENTLERLNAVFPPALRTEAARLLEADCGENLSTSRHAASRHFERIRFAAIKLSNGRIAGLYDAIALAQTDWRDLLVAAGFAEDVDAHMRWHPRPEGR
jgi:hypothetical protein